MSAGFKPSFRALPLAQQWLWPALRPVLALGFVLYGGTAVALRLGHRTSIDFDFFCDRPLDRELIISSLQFMAQSTVVQDGTNTLSLLVSSAGAKQASVKVSFFGSIGFGRVGTPNMTDDQVLQVASLDDLIATKVKVILQRAEAKDYRDIAAMTTAGVDLSRGLAAARTMFGPNFQPSESLKALVYFADGDLGTLSNEEKRILVKAVSAVRDLPTVAIVSRQLAAAINE